MKLLSPKLPPGIADAECVKALVLDWAGTTVDFGSLAPVRTIERIFAEAGIQVREAEIRRDMGLPKKEHIRQILAVPRVSEEWRAKRGKPPTAADLDALYEKFIPIQLSCLAEYSAVIPGVAESVRKFRERGLKIGSSTGYTRAMLDVLLQQSAKGGYTPDCALAPEDVGAGRPEPFMMYENAVRMRVWPLAAIVKAGDTPADIEEGLNAGAWSIGVASTGNGIGVSGKDFEALPANAQDLLLKNARNELQHAGAHYVVDTLGDLDAVLDDIDARIMAAKTSARHANPGV